MRSWCLSGSLLHLPMSAKSFDLLMPFILMFKGIRDLKISFYDRQIKNKIKALANGGFGKDISFPIALCLAKRYKQYPFYTEDKHKYYH